MRQTAQQLLNRINRLNVLATAQTTKHAQAAKVTTEREEKEKKMKNTIYTTNYRSNATDARTKQRLNGSPAVACKLQQTGGKTRYLSRETWETTYTPTQAAETVVGKSNNNALTYQCVIECKREFNLHANTIAANGSRPLWYATETGYCSPTFRNAKWHDRLDSIFKMLDAGKVAIIIRDEDTGEIFDTVHVAGNRDELGRFVKRNERGKTPLLMLIDEVTERRKGYRNYPKH